MNPDPVSHRAEGKETGSLTDDAALVAQAQAGESGAFDALVLRHQREVFAIALRMLGNHDEAQDVAQDAFVQAYRALAGFRRDAKFSTWVIAITLNLCRNRRRWWARYRRVIVASLDEPMDTEDGTSQHEAVDPAPLPDQEAERRERSRHVVGMLQQLSESEREIIVLRDIQGHSYEEIAGLLRCRVGTVKSRLNRARLQLRALLDGTR